MLKKYNGLQWTTVFFVRPPWQSQNGLSLDVPHSRGDPDYKSWDGSYHQPPKTMKTTGFGHLKTMNIYHKNPPKI